MGFVIFFIPEIYIIMAIAAVVGTSVTVAEILTKYLWLITLLLWVPMTYFAIRGFRKKQESMEERLLALFMPASQIIPYYFLVRVLPDLFRGPMDFTFFLTLFGSLPLVCLTLMGIGIGIATVAAKFHKHPAMAALLFLAGNFAVAAFLSHIGVR